MTPAPAEGARNAAIASSGPVIQRRWCSQSVCARRSAPPSSLAPADGALCTGWSQRRPQAAPALRGLRRATRDRACPRRSLPPSPPLDPRPAVPRQGRLPAAPAREPVASGGGGPAVVSGTPSVVHGPSVASRWPPRLRRPHDTSATRRMSKAATILPGRDDLGKSSKGAVSEFGWFMRGSGCSPIPSDKWPFRTEYPP